MYSLFQKKSTYYKQQKRERVVANKKDWHLASCGIPGIQLKKMRHFEDENGKRKELFDSMDCFPMALENSWSR